jgi:hypothetical protein
MKPNPLLVLASGLAVVVLTAFASQLLLPGALMMALPLVVIILLLIEAHR